jgi:PUA domain protein
MKSIQVDQGAIKFVLNGADIMCQGLTSAGGKIEDVKVDQIVLLMAEGKSCPLGVGKMIMTDSEVRNVN